MSQNNSPEQGGQSIILVAVAMVALVLFVAITVDMSNAYHHRRVAQNAADAAALAGAEELGRQLDSKPPSDAAVKEDMNDFAERNGIEDTSAPLGDAFNSNVEGYYLNSSSAQIGAVGGGTVPKKAVGIRAVTHITAPTYFGGIMGFDGYPLEARAAVKFEVACSGGWCMLPVAIHDTGFMTATEKPEGECFNMWDGAGGGNFGWLNWSLNPNDPKLSPIENPYSCQNLDEWGYIGELPDDCSAECLDINMDPEYCQRVDPAHIQYHDQVGGTTGVKNGDMIRDRLKYYIMEQEPVQVVVYDVTQGSKNKGAEQGCAKPTNKGGLRYRVVGFACFYMTGFRLSHGQGATQCDLMDDGVTLACQECDRIKGDPDTILCPSGSSGTYTCDPSTAVDYPGECTTPDGYPCEFETGDVNRISGSFVSCFGGAGGTCKAVGNLLAPNLDE
jgi:hypothetical protein